MKPGTLQRRVAALVSLPVFLCASPGDAAVVTLVQSNATPLVGENFYVDVFGDGFPDTVGATLKLTFSSSVSVLSPSLGAGIVLAPGSPFTGGIAVIPACTPTYISGNACNFSVLAPNVGALPTGNFGGAAAFRINFTTIGPNAANVRIVDDQADFSWTDAHSFTAIPVTYPYSQEPPAPPVVPVPPSRARTARRTRAAGDTRAPRDSGSARDTASHWIRTRRRLLRADDG